MRVRERDSSFASSSSSLSLSLSLLKFTRITRIVVENGPTQARKSDEVSISSMFLFFVFNLTIFVCLITHAMVRMGKLNDDCIPAFCFCVSIYYSFGHVMRVESGNR